DGTERSDQEVVGGQRAKHRRHDAWPEAAGPRAEHDGGEKERVRRGRSPRALAKQAKRQREQCEQRCDAVAPYGRQPRHPGNLCVRPSWRRSAQGFILTDVNPGFVSAGDLVPPVVVSDFSRTFVVSAVSQKNEVRLNADT